CPMRPTWRSCRCRTPRTSSRRRRRSVMFGTKPAPKDASAGARPFLVAFKGADGQITVRLDPKGVPHPGGGGIPPVDPARHYARMFTQTGVTRTEAQALAEIRQLFDAEWSSPTDPGAGGIRN